MSINEANRMFEKIENIFEFSYNKSRQLRKIPAQYLRKFIYKLICLQKQDQFTFKKLNI